MANRKRRNPEATAFAREQRSTANEFAATVWQIVRNRRCCGAKFRREYPIEPYTADFCCAALRLIIEVDGDGHFSEEGQAYDLRRDAFLREQGYEILRLPGFEVLRDPDSVRGRIETFIRANGR